jgi:hypothetical protein
MYYTNLDFVINADTARERSREYLENMDTEEFEIFKNIMESIAWSSSNGNFSLEMPDDIFTEAKQSGRARETICRALRSLDYTVSNMYPPSHHNKFQISW